MADKPVFNARFKDKLWALYGAGVPNDEIAEAFEQTYGCRPDMILETGGGKLAGPKPPILPITVVEFPTVDMSRNLAATFDEKDD